MKKYSRVYKVEERRYRYNYDRMMLEYIAKADEEMLKDNEEWNEKFGKNLWDIEDGYIVVNCIGLFEEDWKESPKYWCEVFNNEIDAEVNFMM